MDDHLGLCCRYHLLQRFSIKRRVDKRIILYLSHKALIHLLTRLATQPQLPVQEPASKTFTLGLPPVIGAKGTGFHQLPAFFTRRFGRLVAVGTSAYAETEPADALGIAVKYGIEILAPEQGQKLALSQVGSRR